MGKTAGKGPWILIMGLLGGGLLIADDPPLNGDLINSSGRVFQQQCHWDGEYPNQTWHCSEAYLAEDPVVPLGAVTYSFYDTDSGPYTWKNDAGEPSAQLKTQIRAIMLRVGLYDVGLNFVEVTEPDLIGSIRFIMTEDVGGSCNCASTEFPYNSPFGDLDEETHNGSDVYLHPDYDYGGPEGSGTEGWTAAPGSVGYRRLYHEVGHALGLGHYTSTIATTHSLGYDSRHSIMVLTSGGWCENQTSGPTTRESAFSPYDVATLEWMYGAALLGPNPWQLEPPCQAD